MAPTKKHRNHQEIKRHRRKPNVPELVYEYLIANGVFDDKEHHVVNRCNCCGQKKFHEEVTDSSRIINKNYRTKQERHKKNGRITKLHNIKQHPTSKDLPSTYLQKYVNNEDTQKARKYIKKALEFGVESGYLIPSDSTYKVLRISSDLMKSDLQRNRSICDTTLSRNSNVPIKLEDQQEQRKRRRRRRRRRLSPRSRSDSRTRRRSKSGRRRSRSRSRGRRRNNPQNLEEVSEDKVDDYEMDKNDPKSNIHTDDVEKGPKTVGSNQADEERSTKKAEEDVSDLSTDEDETDDEEKKDINKP